MTALCNSKKGAKKLTFDGMMTIGQPLDPPLMGATLQQDDTVVIAWSAVTGATNYVVRRSSDGGTTFSDIGSTAGTGFTDVTADPGNSYIYAVRSQDAFGVSGDSNAASMAIPALTSFSITSFTCASRSANLSWPPVASAVGYAISRIGTTTLRSVTTSTSSSVSMPAPSSSGDYNVRVVALNASTVPIALAILHHAPCISTVEEPTQSPL